MQKENGFCQKAYQRDSQGVPDALLIGLEDAPVIRTRRVSIRVQHTEISASVSQIFTTDADPTASPIPADPGPCPDCGSPGSTRLFDAVNALDLAAPVLKTAADEGRLHIFCSPDNQVWICDRSLQHMKEKF